MEWFSAEQYRAACTAARLRPTTVELLRVDMTAAALADIGRFSLFIEGALPGAPLEEGSEAYRRAWRAPWKSSKWIPCRGTGWRLWRKQGKAEVGVGLSYRSLDDPRRFSPGKKKSREPPAFRERPQALAPIGRELSRLHPAHPPTPSGPR